MSIHHDLDIRPKPEKVLYINEVEIVDRTANAYEKDEKQEDNVRIYIPLDLNHKAIIRRLAQIGEKFGYPTDGNEFDYSCEVGRIIAQLEIYDQVWYVWERNCADSPEEKHHSQHGKALVEEMLDILEGWEENSCAECFPYDQIDELEEEYGIAREHHWK